MIGVNGNKFGIEAAKMQLVRHSLWYVRADYTESGSLLGGEYFGNKFPALTPTACILMSPTHLAIHRW